MFKVNSNLVNIIGDCNTRTFKTDYEMSIIEGEFPTYNFSYDLVQYIYNIHTYLYNKMSYGLLLLQPYNSSNNKASFPVEHMSKADIDEITESLRTEGSYTICSNSNETVYLTCTYDMDNIINNISPVVLMVVDNR